MWSNVFIVTAATKSGGGRNGGFLPIGVRLRPVHAACVSVHGLPKLTVVLALASGKPVISWSVTDGTIFAYLPCRRRVGVESDDAVKSSRLFLLIALLGGTLFVRGCDSNSATVTTGLVAPFAEFELKHITLWAVGSFDYQIGLPAEVLEFSWPLLAVNVLALAFFLIVAYRDRPLLKNRIGRALNASLWTTCALFNSAIFLPYVWVWVVLVPTFQVAQLAKQEFPLVEGIAQHTVVDFVGRIYFVACAGLLTLAFALTGFLVRYFFKSPAWRTALRPGLRSIGLMLMPKRGQFSLKAMVIIVLVLSGLFGWVGIKLNEYRHTQQLYAAQNESTAPEELAELYETGEFSIVQYVGSNSAAPGEVIQKIGRDSDARLATRIYWNRSAPPDLLREVVGKHGFDNPGAAALAYNASTPSDLLTQVFRQLDKRDIYHRYALRGIADHPNTPADVLQAIAAQGPVELLCVVLPEQDLYLNYEETNDLNETLFGSRLRQTVRPALLQLLAVHDDPRVRDYVGQQMAGVERSALPDS